MATKTGHNILKEVLLVEKADVEGMLPIQARNLRKLMGYSQNEMARRIGVSSNIVRAAETNKDRRRLTYKFAIYWMACYMASCGEIDIDRFYQALEHKEEEDGEPNA